METATPENPKGNIDVESINTFLIKRNLQMAKRKNKELLMISGKMSMKV